MKKKSKDQGGLIAANGGGVQHTEADAAGMGYTDGSCCGDKIKNMVHFLRERRRGK